MKEISPLIPVWERADKLLRSFQNAARDLKSATLREEIMMIGMLIILFGQYELYNYILKRTELKLVLRKANYFNGRLEKISLNSQKSTFRVIYVN